MPNPKPKKSKISAIEPSSIKNKARREEVYRAQRAAKAKTKHERRRELKKIEEENPEKKEERLKKNIVKTQENMREFDETVVNMEDDEVAQEEETDELAEYFDGKAPKVVITTSPIANKKTHDFTEELLSVIPNAEIIKRGKKSDMKRIIQYCNHHDYTDILVVKEDHKEPTHLIHIHLPNGPTAYYRLTTIVSSKKIEGHARATAHKPELILNRFETRLGHTIGRMFAALFPQVPQFEGRQVVTFHNQRDFIFFRRHRYIFKSGKKASLQEIGPRFTLKLRWLQKGTYDPQNGEFEWIAKSELETSRRRFFL